MEIMRSLLGAVAVSACTIALPLTNAVGAQEQQANPVSTALKNTLQSMQKNLVASAEAMPADKYSFKPTPAQMSFGQLVLHVAGTNYFMCATIAGTKAPQVAKLDPTAAKDVLVARIRESFEYCATTLAPIDDSKLSEVGPFFGGRTISRGGAMLGLAEDWGDHYGAAATYQRLNGILPPTAQPKPAK
jgi:DinB family protein